MKLSNVHTERVFIGVLMLIVIVPAGALAYWLIGLVLAHPAFFFTAAQISLMVSIVAYGLGWIVDYFYERGKEEGHIK